MNFFGGLVKKGSIVGVLCFSVFLGHIPVVHATILGFTYLDIAQSSSNDIAQNGDYNSPLNSNPFPNTQYNNLYAPITYPKTFTQPNDATYSTAYGSITSDITTSSNISNTGAITLSHNVNISNSFPSDLNYGVQWGSGINLQGNFMGNGSTITIPLTVTENSSGFPPNSTAFVSGFIGGPNNFQINFSFPSISTGTTSQDLTFQTIVGDTYVINASTGLGGTVLGNASADLTFLIGAPILPTSISGTPEPSTLALFGTGILLMGVMAYRRKKVAA